MPTKAKRQGTQKKEEKKVVGKNKTTRKQKTRGDKLNTLELSDDGFTTDEEVDDNDERGKSYESCKHFEVQQTDHHEQIKNDSPRKKQKTSNLKSVELKSNIQVAVDLEIEVGKEENVQKEEGKKHLKRKRATKSKTPEDDGKTSQSVVKNVPDEEMKTNKTEDTNVTSKKGRKPKVKIEEQPDDLSQQGDGTSSKERKGKRRHNVESCTSDTNLQEKEKKNGKPKKATSESKLQSSKKEDSKEYRKFVGAHVSISGGLYKSVLEAVDMKAKAFGLFLKSQRQWTSKPLEDKVVEKFKETCEEYGFLPNHILPHGSYLMNCGSPDENSLLKSRNLLIEELQKCEKLGLTLFNFHPGSTCGKTSVEQCLANIAESINLAHSKTKNVITVIENMCCQGHTVGGKFEELRGIIDRVEDKSRIGVCLDTCHAFAAGFDLSTRGGFEEMMSDFEEIVGFKYLKAMHINDSKGTLGCYLDRHENIGKGHIGKEGFKRIMNHPKLDNIPMILETPCPEDNTYAKEVEMLYSMCET